jgi:hypothetical protein
MPVIKRGLPRLIRWLHIYLSMISFMVVLFFAVTGLTLNHAEKFGNQVVTRETKGKMRPGWVNVTDTTKIARLEIVEFFRKTYKITAALSDFRIDDSQCTLSFKGPGFAADVFVDRQTGDYSLVQTSAGFIGIINDLHKGRDTGKGWSIFIDIAAIFLTLVALTGMALLLYLKKRRLAGLLVALLGLGVAYLIYVIWVK